MLFALAGPPGMGDDEERSRECGHEGVCYLSFEIGDPPTPKPRGEGMIAYSKVCETYNSIMQTYSKANSCFAKQVAGRHVGMTGATRDPCSSLLCICFSDCSLRGIAKQAFSCFQMFSDLFKLRAPAGCWHFSSSAMLGPGRCIRLLRK